MAFANTYDFENLSNESERFILDELEKQLTVAPSGKHPQKICMCNDCVLDMAAMALNHVKPLYRCSLLGSLYTAEAVRDESFLKSIQNAVRQAIEKVSANPSHG
jgi:competence protein ComFB